MWAGAVSKVLNAGADPVVNSSVGFLSRPPGMPVGGLPTGSAPQMRTAITIFTHKLMDLKSLIRDIPDFPKPGIMFRDITTLLRHPEGLRYTIDTMGEKCAGLGADYIVGMESRGFIFGAPLAYKLGAGFVPVRKRGKLPAAVHFVEYELEYGTDRLEMHQDALLPGSRVLVADDLLATGGTAKATAQMLQLVGCEIVGFCFVIELAGLGGRQKLPQGVPVVTLVEY